MYRLSETLGIYTPEHILSGTLPFLSWQGVSAAFRILMFCLFLSRLY